MHEKIESIVGGLLGILGYIIFTIGSILPFYAAAVDIKRDQFLWMDLRWNLDFFFHYCFL